jgi:hypothetical protein
MASVLPYDMKSQNVHTLTIILFGSLSASPLPGRSFMPHQAYASMDFNFNLLADAVSLTVVTCLPWSTTSGRLLVTVAVCYPGGSSVASFVVLACLPAKSEFHSKST